MLLNAKELKNSPAEDFSTGKLLSPSIRYYLTCRTICDFFVALIGILILSPLIMLFCIAIKLESKGPAFYRQERVGINGKVFYILKLRSMRVDAEKKGAQWAQKNDPRVTRIGKFIRKTRIDEIPQLFNILKGDMSLIGPRPERPIFTEKFNKEISGFSNRVLVKPGVTGWAQINGGYDITPKEKLKLDIYYIERISIKLDIKIIYKTIKVVFTGDGAR
ncbi:UDP-phosphate N-acetylgalactosaminyl-1-phosphate transferase [Priestia filamentosa]|uniref:UDP-phosphate N-acetylgalactosaminyl-1-phosphate transferase n=1 Tax=Priestia filamentosa TaxID=1402861 RepID=A0A0H4L322_9BACI|nr:UDP-phosphate N-acetylgalactosaminyl-1-phosphate transferase [Priestia filamentosa]